MAFHGGGPIIDIGKLVENLIDGLVGAADTLVKEVLKFLTTQITNIIQTVVAPVLNLILFVPAPKPVGVYFASPTNAPWPEIFNYMFGVTIPLGFTLLIVSWQVGQAGSALNAISVRKTREIDRGLFVGVFLIPASYVLAAVYLQIIRYMTKYIAPSPNAVASTIVGLLDPSQVGNASVVLLAWLIGSTILFLILGAMILNALRVVFLLLVTILLPVLLGLKLGGIPYFDKWADKFIGMYVTLGLASIIMAAGFRLSIILFAGNGINITGLPASDFIAPAFGAVPFILGIIIPAGAITNSLNLQSLGAAAATGGAAAASTASKLKTAKSAGGKAGKAAAGTGPGQKVTGAAESAASRVKEEYSQARQIRADENELEMNAEETSDDIGSTDGPQTQSGPPTPMDGDLPGGPGYDAGAAEADADFVNADDPDGSTDSGFGSDGFDPVNRVSAEGDGVTPPQGSLSIGSGGSSSGAGSGTAATGSTSESSTSESSGGPRTNPTALNENPGDVPEGEQVSMERVKYKESRGGLGPNPWDEPILEDSEGNQVPLDTSEYDPHLEDGETYDIEGLGLQKHDIDADGPYQGDGYELGAPGTSEDGEYAGVSVTEDTDFEKKPGQTYTGDLAGRSSSRVKGAAGAKKDSVVKRGQKAKERVKNKHTINKEDVKSAAKKTKSGLKKASGAGLAGKAAGSAKNRVVEKADESLLTEEARENLGKPKMETDDDSGDADPMSREFVNSVLSDEAVDQLRNMDYDSTGDD
jgi:hypothetical protein